ncbi:MAG: type II secretion system F family protein [Candidatus Gracilibacteria bacterium]|nr:type II secretion system F family protein [Candidatus Gracilibacteria bacterium]
MRTFVAIVYSDAGAEEKLVLKGNTLEEVRSHLRAEGYIIQKLEEQEEVGLWKKLQDIELGARIKPENKIRVTRSLGQMINRGYVLENVVDFLLADEKQKDVIKLLKILQKRMQKGYKDFVDLFMAAEEYFDKEFFSILIAGQKTGTVGQNILDYSEGKAKMLAQKGQLIKTLAPKFVVLGVVGAAFIVIVLGVVPQFTKLFGEKLSLPLGMQIMVFFSDVLTNYGVFVLVANVLLFGGFFALYHFHLGFRYFCQDALIKTPVIGPLLRMVYTRDFLYMMGNLISKGVSLMEAIRIVIDQTSHLCFKGVYEAVEKNLEKGRKLEQALKPLDPQLVAAGMYVEVPSGYLLDSVAQAMTLGSKGGNLGEMLEEAYQTYDIQLQNTMGTTIKVIGAAISLFTYVVIVFMIGSLAMTLFKVMEDPSAIACLCNYS